MKSPGIYTLSALGITTPLVAVVQTPTVNLDGMSAATIYAELLGATGGTSVSALVQSTMDGGVTWLDVARFDFTAAAKKWCVLQGIAAKAVATYAALAAEGVNDGLLGNQFRAIISSVGTFSNTTLSLRAAVR